MAGKLLVMKFGGTSVGSPEAMSQAANIIRHSHLEWPNLIVVTSALSGVTNLLLESTQKTAGGETGFFPQAAERKDLKKTCGRHPGDRRVRLRGAGPRGNHAEALQPTPPVWTATFPTCRWDALA